MLLEWRSAPRMARALRARGPAVVSAFAGFDGQPLNGRPGDHVFVCGR